MYDPNAVLQRISDRPGWVLLFGGIAICANLVYYVEMYRSSSRDACMPLTLLALATFIAHDGNYVLNADKWFSTYDHWFPILFWCWLVVTCAIAIFGFLRLTIRYGRSETRLPMSQRTWALGCLGAMAAGAVVWGIVKANIDDDLYLLSFMVTITWCGISGTTLLVRRGSARGTSVRQWAAFTVMGGSFLVCSQFLGPGFQTLEWYLLSALTVLWGAGLTVAVARAPKWTPMPADVVPALHAEQVSRV